MYKLLKQLENEPSTNKKQEIIIKALEENFQQTYEVFNMALNPFLQSNIKKILEVPIGDKTFDDMFETFVQVFISLSSRNITGKKALFVVKDFLNDCNSEAQEIFTRILKKDLRCGVSVKTVNKCLKQLKKPLIREYKVQLANKYEPTKKYKNTHWWITPKLDGIRCSYNGDKLLSRSGKPLVGFEHVEAELDIFMEQNKLSFVDGELYSHDLEFQEISSIVSKKKDIDYDRKKQLGFHIFTCLCDDNQTTESMYNFINKMWEINEFLYLEFVTSIKIENNYDIIKTNTEYYVKQGYEGCMLRSDDIIYDWKRSDALVKYKFFKEEDLTIVGFIEGTGKYEGMLGALICEGMVEGHFVKVEVGSGFTDTDRIWFWNRRNQFADCKVEIKYQELTDDNSSLRFPVYNKIKERI